MKLIKRIGTKVNEYGKNRQSYGLFLCPVCEKKVEKPVRDGKQANTCGCKRHGDYKTILYKRYTGMKYRCYKETSSDYKNYGARGIKVCNEWRNSYITFKKWALANGYRDNLTIDRIDNDGNYEPNNCRFITIKENSRNKRDNTKIEYEGKTKSVTEWAEVLNINRSTIYSRLDMDWSVERALSSPITKIKITSEIANKIREEHKENNITQKQLSEKYRVSRSYISQIISRGKDK
jgi:predicted XRE-type DNA-binding protein